MISVVKIGGKVVENDALLKAFCEDFASLPGPKILVHGGGVMASEMQKALGQTPQMIEGRRVTDKQALQIVTMVYAGWCNKHIVATLQSMGCNAIGLAGCDGATINAGKRAPRTLADGVTTVDYGYVGDVCGDSVNVDAICKLIDCGFTPVFCAINHDAQGNLLNTNADTVASSLAIALKSSLIYCFEKNGVLSNSDDESSVIPIITPELFGKYSAEGVISAGMLPKIENALESLRKGASSVIIKNSNALLTPSGTSIVL